MVLHTQEIILSALLLHKGFAICFIYTAPVYEVWSPRVEVLGVR